MLASSGALSAMTGLQSVLKEMVGNGVVMVVSPQLHCRLCERMSGVDPACHQVCVCVCVCVGM